MKLIDKDALAAEIERLIKYQRLDDRHGQGVLDGLHAIERFIDTLEVKDVDLEEELKCYCNDYYNCDYPKQIEEENCSEVMPHIISAAKHFFELGLAQKGKEVDLEKDVRQIISLYYEGIKHYEDIIKEEREKNGGSDLAIKMMDGVVDARELSIQYVIDKLKAQKGE